VDAVRFAFGDTSVEVRSACAPLLAALGHLYRVFAEQEVVFPPGDLSEVGGAAPVEAWLGGSRKRFASVGDAVYELDQEIEPRLLAHTGQMLRVHAAAVESAHQTLLLVGLSGSGKTTLALELVKRGWRYLSDEFTIVDAEARTIQPFPRAAIRKRESAGPPGDRIHFDDAWGYRDYLLPDHRADLAPRPLRPRWIVFPTHSPQRPPSVAPLESGEVCARFLPSIFDFDGAERTRWPALANLVEGSRACALSFREAATDLDLALDLLERDTWTPTTLAS